MDNEQLVNYREATRMTSLGERTIRRLIAMEEFPKPIRLTPRRVAFVKSEIEGWMDAKITEARA